MDFSFTSIPYCETGYFSDIVRDYLGNSAALQPFYRHPVSKNGLEAAMAARMQFDTPREVLVKALTAQYKSVGSVSAVDKNIEKLGNKQTFTVTTAHQPAIFTGTLYFIYKILHTIKLAAWLKAEFPQYEFVPVYWMGSEDADLDELGKIYLNAEKLVWDTKQTGAVGKMNTRGLEKMIGRIEGELSVQPFGNELIQLLKECYLKAPDIQTATFRLLHKLFASYGLVVIIPDTPELKRIMHPVFEDDLFHNRSSDIVDKTIDSLSQLYKIQANPREINLFYLEGDRRDRIQKNPAGGFLAGEISFSDEQMREELHSHPERFSPNVILRGLYQETILPNIAFVGGGGEMAYWLELQALFTHFRVPYPVLLIRNSFLIIEKKWGEKIRKMGFHAIDMFKSEQELLSILVSRNKNGQLLLKKELESASELYHALKNKVAAVDRSLEQHVEALQARALKPLQELEKKMLRAEKKKYETEQRQISQLRNALFPLGGLQERIENFMPYYAKWGRSFIDCLYNHSLAIEQEFAILEEQGS